MPFDATPLTAVQKSYLAAADLLERGGWCQGRGRGPGGSKCLVMALVYATIKDADYPKAIEALESRLGKRPADWNDEPGRTKEEVIALLREAAHHG